jgi:hypothetical protein
MGPLGNENHSADQQTTAAGIARAEVLARLHATPEVFARIADWNGSEFALQERLRADFPDEIVRGALRIVELRVRGTVKFSQASSMWFDRVGLEQSTTELVARHKAQRFYGSVWDYCCGIGGDAIMLANHCDVIAVDRDPAACLCTEYNAEAYGVAGRVTIRCADVEALEDRGGLLHIDPDRRAAQAGQADRATSNRRRSLRLESGSPNLEVLSRLIQEFQGGAIKASPAANFGGKFPEAEIELVSLDGECKEATIWFGALAEPGVWRATVLPSGQTIAGDPLAAVAPITELGPFLLDPDPALVRSGLIDLFATRSGLTRLDDEEEYLTGDEPRHSPFVQRFEVLATLPNNDREIRGYFRGSGIGQLEIKCRRIPVDAEVLRRRIPLTGDKAAVLIFARIDGRARAIVCRRVPVLSAVNADQPAPPARGDYC